MIKYVFYFLLILLVASCGTNSLGYFEVEPSRKSANKIDETLYLDFGSHVKNSFSVDQAGVSTLNVKEFRQSLHYALAHTFSGQFKDVKLYRGEQKGFVLRVDLVKSSWLVGRQKNIIREDFRDTLHVQDFGCFVRYASVLFYNKKQVSEINGDVRIKPDYTQIWTIDKLFEEAVKLSCEDMAKKISARK